MHLSGNKKKEPTTLEMEAQNLVNVDQDEEINVNDEARYDALMETRKNRRAGECLYDFLERQVKEQMRTALGQPLQAISSTVLNKMVSKDLQANLRKYKMTGATGGRTPSRGRRSASRGGALGDDLSQGSPTVHFEGQRGRSGGRNSVGGDDGLSASRQIRSCLKQLDTGIGMKVSLLKSLVLKCDETEQNYNRLRNAINYGEMESADRIICDLRALNGSTLASVQDEIGDGANLTQVVGNLTQLISRELQRAKQSGRAQVSNFEASMDGRTGRSMSPLRSALKNNSQMADRGVRRDLSESFARGGSEKLEQLQRQLMELQTENERLKHDSSTMINNYNRKIEAQEDTIAAMNARLEGRLPDPDYELLLRKENEALKTETNLLREKVSELSRELDFVAARADGGNVNEILDAENRRLRGELAEKDREFGRQIDQMRSLLAEKDAVAGKQKNEWAEIYGNMKRETDGLKRDVRMLNKENERLVKQIETSKGGAPLRGNSGSETEVAKRLRKRELECQALWETLRDLYNESQQVYETAQMLDVLAVRALDQKAKKKLSIR